MLVADKLFGRFVPDFGRVVAQTQHDMYHTYTVDEHTIRAIGILAKIESGALKEDHPLSAAVVTNMASKLVGAYVAGGMRFLSRVAPAVLAISATFTVALWLG